MFDVASGQLVATLTHTQQGQFSRDGAFVVGGTAKELIKWSAKDWTKISDAPNGPDFVMQVAAFPEKDLAVVGGLKSARLVRLSSGEEFATVGQGYTNFAAFSTHGALIFDFVGDGFSVWDTTESNIATQRTSATALLRSVPTDTGWPARSPMVV